MVNGTDQNQIVLKKNSQVMNIFGPCVWTLNRIWKC